MSSSNNGNRNNNSRKNDSDGDSNNSGGSWGSAFKMVVGAVATTMVTRGLMALLSSAASSPRVPIGELRHVHTALQGKWKKPEIGWLKLNVDGSREHHNGPSAGCGGVLRDSSGKWLLGFSMKLDPTNIQVHNTELQAILTGLELAWEMDVAQLIVESDSESVVRMVEKGLGSKFGHAEFDIVQRIRKLRFDPKWKVKLVCVPRTANRVANWLANNDARMLSSYDVLCKYNFVPGNCFRLLLEDTAGS